MTGAHNRRLPEDFNAMAMTNTMVTRALAGALQSDLPSGDAFTMSKMSGITVTAMSISTVPATTGVTSRRNNESLAASKNWNSEDATTSTANKPGPPSTSAVTHTAMNAPEVPTSSTYPAPMRPNRTAWRIVLTPLTIAAANTAQVRYESLPSAARMTIAGVSTMPAMVSTANWMPIPAVSAVGGLSSGSNRMCRCPIGSPWFIAPMLARCDNSFKPQSQPTNAYSTTRPPCSAGHGEAISLPFR